MTGRTREMAANIVVAVAVFLVIAWVLRGILGAVLWLANLVAFVVVIIALLIFARWVRRG